MDYCYPEKIKKMFKEKYLKLAVGVICFIVLGFILILQWKKDKGLSDRRKFTIGYISSYQLSTMANADINYTYSVGNMTYTVNHIFQIKTEIVKKNNLEKKAFLVIYDSLQPRN